MPAHEVPASVLTQSLSGVQRVVHLIAMHHHQHEIATRARVTQNIEQRFPVICRLPAEGSYILPVSIGTSTPDLVDPLEISAVTEQFRNVLEAFSAGALQQFRKLVPDAAYRKNISKALKDSVPNKRSGYRFSVLTSEGHPFFDAHGALPFIEELLRPVHEPVEAISVVTGKFSRVDFDARKIEILHPATNTMLDCLYKDDVEPLLLNNPRELIQVVGTVELDGAGILQRITDVQDILEVDLSPITVSRVSTEEVDLFAVKPFTLTPALSDTKQFYEIDDDEIGISLIAFTRDELIDAVTEEIAVLWTEYAKECDENLTDGAKKLKSRLLQAFEERA